MLARRNLSDIDKAEVFVKFFTVFFGVDAILDVGTNRIWDCSITSSRAS